MSEQDTPTDSPDESPSGGAERAAAETPAEAPEAPAGESPAEAPEAPAAESPAEAPEAPAAESPAEAPEAPAAESPAEAPEAPAAESPAETQPTSAGETEAETQQTPAAASGEVEQQAPGAPAAAGGSITRGRLIFVDALIFVTTILAVVAMLSVWANRLLFNPDNWANTSTQLLQNNDIRSATSNYVVDQLYNNVNVAALIRSGLPPRLDALAGPAAGALRNLAVQGVNAALERPRVQTLWANANRLADKSFIAVVNGGKGPVGIKSGVVTLDLAAIVDDVAARLGLPPGLGAKLPPSVANLTVFKSDQLGFVQTVGNAVKGLALWLSILVPLLYGLAIFLAHRHRRRTLMTVGFAIVIAGVIGIAGRKILESAITNSLVSNAAARPAVRATVGIGTAILSEIAVAFILVGIVVVIAAWFAGPAHLATAGRRVISPFLRDRAAASFAIVAAVMILIFLWQPIPATGTPVGIVVFMLLALAGTEVLRRQTAVEFPDAHEGDATAALRARVEHFRQSRHHQPEPSNGNATSLPEQLERLRALRDDGSITAEEYDAAKANLLHA